MRKWQKIGDRHFYFSDGKEPSSSFHDYNIHFGEAGMLLNRREYLKYRKYLRTLNKIKHDANQDTSLWKKT